MTDLDEHICNNLKDRQQRFTVEKYVVGLAGQAMGYEKLKLYPSLLDAGPEAPAKVREVAAALKKKLFEPRIGKVNRSVNPATVDKRVADREKAIERKKWVKENVGQ
jgi:hypothetical protein